MLLTTIAQDDARMLNITDLVLQGSSSVDLYWRRCLSNARETIVGTCNHVWSSGCLDWINSTTMADEARSRTGIILHLKEGSIIHMYKWNRKNPQTSAFSSNWKLFTLLTLVLIWCNDFFFACVNILFEFHRVSY